MVGRLLRAGKPWTTISTARLGSATGRRRKHLRIAGERASTAWRDPAPKVGVIAGKSTEADDALVLLQDTAARTQSGRCALFGVPRRLLAAWLGKTRPTA